MNGISILMYHQVGNFPTVKLHRASYTNLVHFRRQMAFLKRWGANVLTMTEAVAALRGERPIPPRAVVLTFDDGYRSFIDTAVPVLQEYGFPAIVYVLASKAGDDAGWYAVDGQPTPPLMTWDEVRRLPALGMEVGSHGLFHTALKGVDAPTLRAELADSKRIIEDQLGRAVPHFCYPFGSVDQAAIDACAAAGYSSAVTCQRGAAYPALDLLALPRKSIRQGHDIPMLLWKLYTKNGLKGAPLHRSAA
ncbi:polysaccharide deacetylase family protein [Solimonas marina]|uniref:Polysaccharide deacetylase family protein n=1 Tax=Solimonas marina TaxID=2714601 RepID=A0A969WCK0_9GAMM|nr:polysaccharide deacetylase family protein [Solimonas marina]NKF23605.1 polysaccharide deacetylase family protein [Solimonas marina]